jgi:hypothetical protein
LFNTLADVLPVHAELFGRKTRRRDEAFAFDEKPQLNSQDFDASDSAEGKTYILANS